MPGTAGGGGEGRVRARGLRLQAVFGLRRAASIKFQPDYITALNSISSRAFWKHTKHFWRRFIAWQPALLRDEIDRLLQSYGSKFQISLRNT